MRHAASSTGATCGQPPTSHGGTHGGGTSRSGRLPAHAQSWPLSARMHRLLTFSPACTHARAMLYHRAGSPSHQAPMRICAPTAGVHETAGDVVAACAMPVSSSNASKLDPGAQGALHTTQRSPGHCALLAFPSMAFGHVVMHACTAPQPCARGLGARWWWVPPQRFFLAIAAKSWR
jgi:hypothetical protein